MKSWTRVVAALLMAGAAACADDAGTHLGPTAPPDTVGAGGPGEPDVGFVVVGVYPDVNGFGKPDILMAKRVNPTC